MVRCSKCGEIVSATKKYCIFCGVRLKGGGGNRKLGITLIVSGIVLIAIGVGLATTYLSFVWLSPMFIMLTIPLLWVGVSEYRKS